MTSCDLNWNEFCRDDGTTAHSGAALKHQSGRGPRVNGAIRARRVRLVAADGTAMGVVGIEQARAAAAAADLDLVEVAPNADPPVCKILSYSKWQYEQSQKERERRRHHVEVKEMKFNVRIGDGDVAVKCRKIIEMLRAGNRVKLIVQMRGRETSHPELAQALLNRVIENVREAGSVEGRSGRDGNRYQTLLVPRTH